MKPKPEDFNMDKCDDCIRITRIDNSDDMHTHCKSKRIARLIIKNVCNEKIPYDSSIHTLQSMTRLTCNEEYRGKITELIKTKKQNGKKQDYFNPHKKFT